MRFYNARARVAKRCPQRTHVFSCHLRFGSPDVAICTNSEDSLHGDPMSRSPDTAAPMITQERLSRPDHLGLDVFL